MVSGGGAVGGEIFVNIRTEGGMGGGVPGAGGVPRPVGGGAAPKDPAMSMLNADQKKQLEDARQKSKALKEYQDFQKLKNKENQNELLNELQRARRQATMVAGAVTTGMLARNSKIMSTSMGALNTMFSAFIDVFLMPFIPLIIPVLKYIADLLPKWMGWTQKFADLFEENPLAALKWASEEFKKYVKEWGIDVGAMLGFSRVEVEKFYKDVGIWADNAWINIQEAWTKSVDYVKELWERSGHDIGEAFKLASLDAWKEFKELAVAAWKEFKDWQPEVAANIEKYWLSSSTFITSAWCNAVTFITDAWAAGGGTIVGFFGQVAGSVGRKMVEGLSWLWSAEGGGMKERFVSMWQWITDNIFDKIGDYLQDKTGGRMGFGHSGASVDVGRNQGGWAGWEGVGGFDAPGVGRVDVGGPGMEMGSAMLWNMNPKNPDVWKSILGGAFQGLKDIFTTDPTAPGGFAGGKSDAEMDIRDRIRITERYNQQIFTHENIGRVMRDLVAKGFIASEIPTAREEFYIEQGFLTDPRFAGHLKKVDLYRANGKWTALLDFEANFNPPAEIDGFP